MKLCCRIIGRIFLLGGLAMLFGCKEYHLYKFAPVEIDVLGGELIIEVDGQYKENKSEDKTITSWEGPYYLTFDFYIAKDKNITKFELEGLTVVGQDSSEILNYKKIVSSDLTDLSRWDDAKDLRYKITAVTGKLDAVTLKYESYQLDATFVVYMDGKRFKEEKISVLVKTKFKKERRASWFERVMSV